MTQGHDLGGLIKFTQSEETWAERLAAVVDEHFVPAMEEFELDFEDLEDLLGEQATWTLWGCAFEDFLTQRWEPDGANVVEAYLKRRGWSDEGQNRAYMEALQDAWVSLHEVSDVVPGESMRLRDLLTGTEPVTVFEKSATQALKQWDRVVVRVVPVCDRHVISGGLLPFSAEAIDLLFEGLRDVLQLRKTQDPKLSAEQLRECAPIFSNAWLFTHLPRLLDPAVPTLTNTDGDDLEFRDLRFPFATGVLQHQVAASLDQLEDLERSGPKSWNWLAPSSRGVSARGNRKGSGLAVGSAFDGNTILGTVELKGKSLTLYVNSIQRADRGEALISAAAGRLLRTPLTTIQTVDQAMQERKTRRADQTDDEDEIAPEIALKLMMDHLDRHYRETLDQPIPALGGKTPRQAVRNATGRKKVVEWLKLLENSSAKNTGTPMADYDFSWMWDELGVAEERR